VLGFRVSPRTSPNLLFSIELHNTRVAATPSAFLQVAVSKAAIPPVLVSAFFAYSRFRTALGLIGAEETRSVSNNWPRHGALLAEVANFEAKKGFVTAYAIRTKVAFK